MRSAPQKQPRPKTARSRPSGKGGCSGVPSTSWRAGTGIGVSRPGRASAGSIMRVFAREKSMETRYLRRARSLRLEGGATGPLGGGPGPSFLPDLRSSLVELLGEVLRRVPDRLLAAALAHQP